jgi:hypothetical protein
MATSIPFRKKKAALKNSWSIRWKESDSRSILIHVEVKIFGRFEVKIKWIGVFICILVCIGCSKAKEGEWKGSVENENNRLYAPEHDENNFPVIKRYEIIWERESIPPRS